jgi:predicted dehydrogenase
MLVARAEGGIMDEMGVGLVGAGGIAALLHLPEIERAEGMRVVHIADVREDRMEKLAARHGIARRSTGIDELLSDDEVEGVIVALPHPLHAEAGLKSVEAGRHLFMQKPLCATMEEADRLAAACEARPELAVYCRPSFPPAVRKMREMVEAGAVGRLSGGAARHSHGGPEVYYAEVADAFGEPRQKENLWFFDAASASVGALFDMGVYAVAGLVAVMGRAVSVTARLTTVDKPTRLEDTASLIIEFESGALAAAETSWCDPARTSFTRVHGTLGKLVSPGADGSGLDHVRPSSFTREKAPPIVERVELAEEENQHAEWMRCAREGGQPRFSNIWAARHVTEILLGAIRSSETGSRVELATDPAGR